MWWRKKVKEAPDQWFLDKLKEVDFSTWTVTDHRATHPEGKFCFWITNGFSYFRDYTEFNEATPVLRFMTYLERRAVWNEFCKQQRDKVLGEFFS